MFAEFSQASLWASSCSIFPLPPFSVSNIKDNALSKGTQVFFSSFIQAPYVNTKSTLPVSQCAILSLLLTLSHCCHLFLLIKSSFPQYLISLVLNSSFLDLLISTGFILIYVQSTSRNTPIYFTLI